MPTKARRHPRPRSTTRAPERQPGTREADGAQERVAAHVALQARAINDDLAARVLELAQANRELETFSFTVSHDLRTPLTIIENYAHVLLKGHAGELTPEATKALQGIHAAVMRMGLLIQNILGLSRVMRLPLRRERTDLADLARTVLAELAERDPGRKVRVKVPAHIWADADPAFVRIVLGNLLGNAWKFTGKKRQATIEFGQTQQGGLQTYYVRDNGAGFSMDQAGRLFQLFERLHPAGDFAGTGIGLATVARAVQRHNGTAWAEAVPGRGATFYFTLGQTATATPRPAGARAVTATEATP